MPIGDIISLISCDYLDLGGNASQMGKGPSFWVHDVLSIMPLMCRSLIRDGCHVVLPPKAKRHAGADRFVSIITQT